MRAREFVTERKKKRKVPKSAAYGPGPYGLYGYNAGYSGDSGDGGGVEENSGDNNEDYHPNDTPPGPITKPTMPKGSVKVDVSDVYDWYKLGMHISDLKGLGKHDFGEGPPSTMFSFGSEEEEHEYIDALQKTGLTTTDIDPIDPNQPKGMPKQKTDPRFNVNENIGSRAVSELKSALIAQEEKLKSATDDQVYDIIDKIMTRIAKAHGISGKDLHDMWVKKYKQIPDKWIMKENFADEKKNVEFNHKFDYNYDDQIDHVLINATIDNKPIGYLELATDDPYYGVFYVEHSELQPEYRRQGIGKAMYQYAQDLPEVKELNPGASQSSAAKHLWSKMKENFADGKNPGRKGLAKRSGVNTKASVSDLRKTAKDSTGEKQRMAHWLANMKAGKNK